MMFEKFEGDVPFYENSKLDLKEEDSQIIEGLRNTVSSVDENLEKFRFSDAADSVYQFMWHEVADKYIEHVKDREDKEVALSVLRFVYLSGLKLLHPFMPFVTEAIWSKMPRSESDSKSMLISASWPKL